MSKSIRWALQLWYALLLVAILASFGTFLFYRLQRERFEAVDAELQRAAQQLLVSLQPPPPPPPRFRPRGNPGEEPPRRGREDDRRGGPPDGPRGNPDDHRDEPPPPRRGREDPWRGGPPDGPPEGPPNGPPWMDEPPGPLAEIPEFVLRRYAGDSEDTPYFVIWRPDGSVQRASDPTRKIPYPGPPRPGIDIPGQPLFRQREGVREACLTAPRGLRVVVGRSVRREQNQSGRLVGLLAMTGGGILAVGLAGGWLISGRVLKPIQAISAMAQSISASNLSRRINLADTKSELGSLAGVLNDMFARLDAAFEQQVRFTADASHELRTPLAIIHTHAELALARERSAPEYRQTLDKCLRASKRMKSLVDSLLVLSRADAGKLDIKVQPCDLREVAEECLALVAPLATEAKVQLEPDLPSIQIDADPFRLTQVITNLLTNAIRYNRQGGKVAFTMATEGSEVVLSVKDTGIGIPAESQTHIFERFFRVDKSRTREMGGAGLGLAISKSIVEAHKGTITFTSLIGVGTTFVVRLPRTSALSTVV